MSWAQRAAILILGLAGCVADNLVACPDDVACPAGTQCDIVHGGCITPAQAQACIGMADHTACRAAQVIGYCLDQICVDPGCGNHIIDPGELCDDGNHIDGDGCSATCLSREQCGDGALDLELGEECDDGNLESHDGCDSRCLVETATWTVADLGPSQAEPRWTTFDPALGKVVLVADGNVWAWDGTQWSVAGTGGPRTGADYSVAYDTARSRLVVIAAAPMGSDILVPDPSRDQVYEWDGATWTSGTTTNAPAASSFVIAYDEAHANMVGFGTTTSNTLVAATLDGATGAWTSVTVPGAMAGATDLAIAFDRARGRVVLVGSVGGFSVTAEWDGTGWSSSAPAMAATGGWSAFYDPSIAHVVVIGSTASSGSTPVQSWNGSVWSSLTAVPGTRNHPSVGFDATRGVRVVFGGDGASGVPDDVVEDRGTGWTVVARTTPPPAVDQACSFDEARQRLVCAGPAATLSETWAWTGTWSLLPTDAGDLMPSLAYDPVRGSVVGVANGQLAVLGDTSWQLTDLSVAILHPEAIAFDPSTRTLVASYSELFTGTVYTVVIDEQTQARAFAGPPLTSIAFDARNGAMVGTTPNDTMQLANDVWSQVVGPGTGYTAITNARRGTVEFVGVPHDVERDGASWNDFAPPPIELVGSTVFDQSTGELFQIGADGTSRFMLHRTWQSSTPFEDCAGTSDLDGDGLIGCADPDCWSQCAPACPPFTTCM